MKKRENSKNQECRPVMNLPEEYSVFDLRSGYDPEKITDFIQKGGWAVGGYHEQREGMYVAEQYENRRNIHMGLDIWAPAGEPVFAALAGEVAYLTNHSEKGNYGGTIILRHQFEGRDLFALYGHLSVKSVEMTEPGRKFKAGERVGWLGTQHENGNWPPHLHYQLSWEDPGEADMPGVVSAEEESEALKRYPDPGMVTGSIY